VALTVKTICAPQLVGIWCSI